VTKSDAQDEESAPVEFVDEQLQMAVKHLQTELRGTP